MVTPTCPALGGLSHWSLFWSLRGSISGPTSTAPSAILGRGPSPAVASDHDFEAECSRHPRRSGPPGDGWASCPATRSSRSTAPLNTKPTAAGSRTARQRLDTSLDRTDMAELTRLGRSSAMPSASRPSPSQPPWSHARPSAPARGPNSSPSHQLLVAANGRDGGRVRANRASSRPALGASRHAGPHLRARGLGDGRCHPSEHDRRGGSAGVNVTGRRGEHGVLGWLIEAVEDAERPPAIRPPPRGC